MQFKRYRLNLLCVRLCWALIPFCAFFAPPPQAMQFKRYRLFCCPC